MTMRNWHSSANATIYLSASFTVEADKLPFSLGVWNVFGAFCLLKTRKLPRGTRKMAPIKRGFTETVVFLKPQRISKSDLRLLLIARRCPGWLFSWILHQIRKWTNYTCIVKLLKPESNIIFNFSSRSKINWIIGWTITWEKHGNFP